MITFKQLRYFEALSRERHFGRAAESVHVSQPALSAQIMEMEASLGARLVERGRRKVILTREGKRVLAHARTVLTSMAELERAARPSSAPLVGPLAIGLIPTVAPISFPGWCRI
nr:LysR family transcriptional regulator [Marinicella sp. W31]MDC2876294.1 LysR family transcriptional regulator [Marinicella sp. W31]